jgi:hypothetical protein
MQKDQHIIYSEEQKLNLKKWVFIPIAIALGMFILIMVVPLLYFYITKGTAGITENITPPLVIVMTTGALIPCIILFLSRKRMKLQLNISNQGMKYTYRSLSTKEGFIPWDQISSVEVKKYPFSATRPGDQKAIWLKGKEAYIMTVDLIGVEIKMKDGKFKFFTTDNSEELVKAIRNLNLNIEIIK